MYEIAIHALCNLASWTYYIIILKQICWLINKLMLFKRSIIAHNYEELNTASLYDLGLVGLYSTVFGGLCMQVSNNEHMVSASHFDLL